MTVLNPPAEHDVREVIALSRNLSPFTITMIGVGGMIGAGIFVLTGIAAGVAGPALILVFVLNGLVTGCTAMAYAELGSAFPEAGGGYLWVKEGLGGAQGYLAGWMSWFAHSVAGSLYGLAFGRFAAELWNNLLLPTFGLSTHQMTLIGTTLVILAFVTINYRGASETGTVGNVVTMTKITILGLFVLFGLMVMFHAPDWPARFTTDFLPKGPLSVIVAMGLTFIAFEGYEIIAQSGEEAVNPKRNIPRAILWAILIAVVIYVLVGVTALGATKAPPGMQIYEYLGAQKEIAIVDVAQQTFPWGIGGILLLFSGLVSTMSALNATTYSSSRVSFAMGRDQNLPSFFARIHPLRHTPHWAVVASGMLMLGMAWSLPLESVAAAADIMFLLLFLQVNAALMRLRHTRPDMDRGFVSPWFPVFPLVAIGCNAFLAAYLFVFSPSAWYVALGWIVVGLLAYYTHFVHIEAMEKPKEILLEEVLVSRDYSVVVPVATQEQARILGHIGAVLAQVNRGELLALSLVKVPPQMTLGEGRLLLKEGRPLLDTVVAQGKEREVPVHTIIRLGRDVADGIRKTVVENASDLLILGWPGHTSTSGRLFGSVIDPIVSDPPTDIALVRHRAYRPLHSVLVPVAGGLNSRRATLMAVNMARAAEQGPAPVSLLHMVPVGPSTGDLVRAEQAFKEALVGIDYPYIQKRIVEGEDVVATVLGVAAGDETTPAYDLIVVGATREPLLKSLLMGNYPAQIAQRASVTVIMVKRRSNPLQSLLRKTVLVPATQTEAHGPSQGASDS
jgi:amino acid transporter/nucleotide-binding universal stress UspA family protein